MRSLLLNLLLLLHTSLVPSGTTGLLLRRRGAWGSLVVRGRVPSRRGGRLFVDVQQQRSPVLRFARQELRSLRLRRGSPMIGVSAFAAMATSAPVGREFLLGTCRGRHHGSRHHRFGFGELLGSPGLLALAPLFFLFGRTFHRRRAMVAVSSAAVPMSWGLWHAPDAAVALSSATRRSFGHFVLGRLDAHPGVSSRSASFVVRRA